MSGRHGISISCKVIKFVDGSDINSHRAGPAVVAVDTFSHRVRRLEGTDHRIIPFFSGGLKKLQQLFRLRRGIHPRQHGKNSGAVQGQGMQKNLLSFPNRLIRLDFTCPEPDSFQYNCSMYRRRGIASHAVMDILNRHHDHRILFTQANRKNEIHLSTQIKLPPYDSNR